MQILVSSSEFKYGNIGTAHNENLIHYSYAASTNFKGIFAQKKNITIKGTE